MRRRPLCQGVFSALVSQPVLPPALVLPEPEQFCGHIKESPLPHAVYLVAGWLGLGFTSGFSLWRLSQPATLKQSGAAGYFIPCQD